MTLLSAQQYLTAGIAARFRHTSAAQHALFAVLNARWHFDIDLARQGGHAHSAAEDGHAHGQRHVNVHVDAFAAEQLVRRDVDLQVEVPWWTALGSRVALALQADVVALVDARGDLDAQRLQLFFHARALAHAARLFDHNALALALATRALHAHEAHGHDLHARATARLAA